MRVLPHIGNEKLCLVSFLLIVKIVLTNVFAIILLLCCRNLFYLLCRCSRITILKLVYFVCELKDL
jgi:hypothetical protein